MSATPRPTGCPYYIKGADRPEMLTVDDTWFGVIERLVTEPPCPPTRSLEWVRK